MKKPLSICIVIPYFGKWPCWINFFLRSCAFNPSITWRIFTDCGTPDYHVDHVHITPMTLKEFNELASDKLHLKIALQRPYKLCDLKPAYQVIFEDWLKEYDFWGYSDIDVIYGNIRKFITDDILSNFDVISCSERLVSGHFTVIRNAEKTNRLFTNSPKYQRIFTDIERHYAFDEIYRYRKFEYLFERSVRKGKELAICFFHPEMAKTFGEERNFFTTPLHRSPLDFTHIVREKAEKGALRVYHQMTYLTHRLYRRQGIKDLEACWDSGTLTDSVYHHEAQYFHFFGPAKESRFRVPDFSPDIKRFQISKYGIVVSPM